MKRWQNWVIGAGLVVVAWGVAAITPPEDAREAPFAVTVGIGERGVGRSIEVTVTDVQRATSATDGKWSADGNWVIVDLTASAVAAETGSSLYTVTFDIDGRTYSASERPASMSGKPLSVGLPRSGSVAFELPPDLDEGRGVLAFSENGDTRLDSLIQVPIDLGELPVGDSARLAATDWTRP